MKALDPAHVLSPLEQDIMKCLWPSSKKTVREIYLSLRKHRKLALTSVAVLLDRLFQQGIVGRSAEPSRGGVRYTYFPSHDKKSFERSIIDRTVNSLLKKFGENAAAYFDERFAKK